MFRVFVVKTNEGANVRNISFRLADLECCKKEREKLKQQLMELLSIRHPTREEVEEISLIKRVRARLKSYIQLAETVAGVAM